jgi:hypothetical protein
VLYSLFNTYVCCFLWLLFWLQLVLVKCWGRASSPHIVLPRVSWIGPCFTLFWATLSPSRAARAGSAGHIWRERRRIIFQEDQASSTYTCLQGWALSIYVPFTVEVNEDGSWSMDCSCTMKLPRLFLPCTTRRRKRLFLRFKYKYNILLISEPSNGVFSREIRLSLHFRTCI